MEGVLGSSILNGSEKKIWREARSSKFFGSILSDADIISLQELCMTPSIHYLSTTDIQTGRKLIEISLNSLNHYHHIACLTVADILLEKETLDLYGTINHTFYNKSFLTATEDFLIEAPYIDFIWIELTDILCQKISEFDLKKAAEILTLHKEIPLLVINYKK